MVRYQIRLNIVLSRTSEHNNIKNVIFTNNDLLFDVISKHKTENQKVFVIGGSEIYSLLISYCVVLHITIVYDNEIKGDCIFPIGPEYIQQKYSIIDKSDIMCSKNDTKYQYITYNKIA